MKKTSLVWIAVSGVVMVLFPWLAVTFVKGDGGMAVCFLLFFGVNPVYVMVNGAFAGTNQRYDWIQPVSAPILFLLAAWVLFDMGETAFVQYAVLYLGLGLGAMLISGMLSKRPSSGG